jgi:4-amino-4-deoxy-L-arabinose transferase-like glycosyltransferase
MKPARARAAGKRAPQPESTHRPRWPQWIFLILILMIAAILRMYGIGTEDVWVDEANTVLIAEQTLPGIAGSEVQATNPVLYHMGLHVWMRLFGEGAAALRMFSALLGVLLVLFLYRVTRALFRESAAWVVAVLAAVAPLQIYHSQQIRMYTLLPAASVLAMYFCIRYLEDGRPLHLAGCAAATMAALFTHNYGIFLLPAHAAALLFLGTPRRRWILAGLLVVLAASRTTLWYPMLRHATDHQSASPGSQTWMATLWEENGFLGSLLATLKAFVPGGAQPKHIPVPSVAWIAAGSLLLTTIFCLLGALQLLQRGSGPNPQRSRIAVCFLYLIVPLLVAGLASTLTTPVYVAGRCDQLVFPIFLLLVATGIRRLKLGVVRIAAVAVLVLFSGMTLNSYYRSRSAGGSSTIAAAIRERMVPGDAVLCTSMIRAPLEYYLRDSREQLAFFSYPKSTAQHLAYQDTGALQGDPDRMIREAQEIEASIRQGGSRSGRCFLVMVARSENRYLLEHFSTVTASVPTEELGVFRQTLLPAPVHVWLIDFAG